MYGIRNLLRYGIGTKCRMESSRSDVWHQSEGSYTLTRDAMPSQSDGFHSPHFARRLHTNPSDWIEKSKSYDLLFSGGDEGSLNPNFKSLAFEVSTPRAAQTHARKQATSVSKPTAPKTTLQGEKTCRWKNGRIAPFSANALLTKREKSGIM